MSAKHVCLSALAALGLALASASLAAAQSYPDKPIKLVVPFPPGGPIDTMARLIGQRLSASFGQQVVVENRPGAGATIGSKAVASAEPDGYTLLFGSSGSLAVAPALYSNIDYDPIKLFAPVATVALLPHVLVVGLPVPARTVRDLIDIAKSNPGKPELRRRAGTPPHMLGTLFKTRAESTWSTFPIGGQRSRSPTCSAGQTQFTIDGLVGLYPLIKEGKLRPLAVAPPVRWPDLPDVPTWSRADFRISFTTPGPAWSRRPARRPRSSASSMPRSTRACAPPR